MNNVLESTNTYGGIGMNNETHNSEYDAWERGYREAMLDVYCFLTANEQVLDLDPAHFQLISTMAEQVNDRNGRLIQVG